MKLEIIDLTFIGRGATFYTQEENTSAYFIELSLDVELSFQNDILQFLNLHVNKIHL